MSDESAASNADEPATGADVAAPDDEVATPNESAADDDSADSDAFSLPACPCCGDPVRSVTTRGPMGHFAAPCGCRVGPPDL